jgi:hypothetical protein
MVKSREKTLLILLVAALALVLVPPTGANDKKKKDDAADPVAWGMLTQNIGCVIFKEYSKTNGKFYGVAVTTKTFNELEFIEAQNYTLDQKEWKEDQDGLNELQRIAVKDRIKFVKIPGKNYSDQQLAKARAMCSESQAAQ